MTEAEINGDDALPDGWRVFTDSDVTSYGFATTTDFTFEAFGANFKPQGHSRRWKTTRDGMRRLYQAARLVPMGSLLGYKRYLNDFSIYELNNNWTDVAGIQSRTDPKIYIVQTTNRVIERCMLMSTDPGDLILDPTCGSGTTAYVAEQWGRRWITCDTSRVALALARTRLIAARYPYYLLADSPEGVQKEAEVTKQLPSQFPTEVDVRRGFIYKRVPHITLKSIANNEEIDGPTHRPHTKKERMGKDGKGSWAFPLISNNARLLPKLLPNKSRWRAMLSDSGGVFRL